MGNLFNKQEEEGPINNIPSELLLLILTRLIPTPDTLYSCRKICKSWKLILKQNFSQIISSYSLDIPLSFKTQFLNGCTCEWTLPQDSQILDTNLFNYNPRVGRTSSEPNRNGSKQIICLSERYNKLLKNCFEIYPSLEYFCSGVFFEDLGNHGGFHRGGAKSWLVRMHCLRDEEPVNFEIYFAQYYDDGHNDYVDLRVDAFHKNWKKYLKSYESEKEGVEMEMMDYWKLIGRVLGISRKLDAFVCILFMLDAILGGMRKDYYPLLKYYGKEGFDEFDGERLKAALRGKNPYEIF